MRNIIRQLISPLLQKMIHLDEKGDRMDGRKQVEQR